MGRKNKRQREGRRASPTSNTAPSPGAFFAAITKAWHRHIGDTSPDRRLLSWALGTLWASKLILLSRNAGSIAFDGDPAVWEGLEQMSDTLADQYLSALRHEIGVDVALPGHLASERSYLRLVRGTRVFRWSQVTVTPNEPLPIEPQRLDEAHEPAMELAGRIIEEVGRRRAKRSSAESQQLISEVVAMVAAAKLALAITGNGKLSAVLEHLAELSAGHDFRSLT